MRAYSIFYEAEDSKGWHRASLSRATHVSIYAPGTDCYEAQLPGATHIRLKYPEQQELQHSIMMAMNSTQQFGSNLAKSIVRDRLHNLLELNVFNDEDND